MLAALVLRRLPHKVFEQNFLDNLASTKHSRTLLDLKGPFKQAYLPRAFES